MIKKEIFGYLNLKEELKEIQEKNKNKEKVKNKIEEEEKKVIIKYILKNKFLEVGILNYGGIITDILMANKDNKIENIVLGYDNIKDYQEKSPHFGALTGRMAGRISNGEFILCGKKYKLAQNNSTNNIHGGIKGLDKRIWKVRELNLKKENNEGIELSYISPHLEEGFPGKVIFKVRYILDNETLEIDYSGEADMETIINLTNHSYFNLSGNCKEDILNHELFIDSDEILELNKESCPTGKKIKVEKTPFDFRQLKKIGKDIKVNHEQLLLGKGYDHPFILNRNQNKNLNKINNKENIKAILYDEKSGRKLEVMTDQKSIVLYTGNYLGEEQGELSCKVLSKERLGVCLEAQDIPNHINLENFETKIYSKTNKYLANTRYKFTLKK